ncbi:hypothetical protein BN381_330100 [Candidatus Microthrix parvicella RN1]|uniref:Uncharacterized protein n=1 Tax=Candidatus Neomicrothrix parvicella RN1 TaxID=1229780 RepID=R4Z0B0_9ACTN|nr:hypothetical protein BN381_330100 [Candidatus Microthrix parvicella RN1]
MPPDLRFISTMQLGSGRAAAAYRVAGGQTILVLATQVSHRIVWKGPHDETVAQIDNDHAIRVPPRPGRRRNRDLPVPGDVHDRS